MTSKPIASLVLLTIGLGGCLHVLAPATFEGGTPEMRPEIFFAGTTNSSGVVEDTAKAESLVANALRELA